MLRRVWDLARAVSWTAVIAAGLVVAAGVCLATGVEDWPGFLVKAALVPAVLSLRGPLDQLVAELRLR